MTPEPQRPISILIVEDEGITALDASDQLTSLGYTVPATVFSAADALRQVDELRPDLVLMDIHLQGDVDGIAAAREIRARYDVPVVYATAYSDDATLRRARVAEPFGYLVKPFDERELRSTIEMALYKHSVERQRNELLAMVSHDIRNPLAVILSYSDILDEDFQGGRLVEAADVLQRLRSTALSVHALVTNYLDVCRIESGALALQREGFPLRALVERVAEQYGAEARRRSVSLGLACADGLPDVDADLLACERIVTNLVYNALKFTPAGGRVDVRTAVRGDAVALAIADTGPGIPAARLPRLFDKFQRVGSREAGGTGLGLFIVRTLAETQGGSVEVESAPGQGSCFTVLLPARRRA